MSTEYNQNVDDNVRKFFDKNDYLAAFKAYWYSDIPKEVIHKWYDCEKAIMPVFGLTCCSILSRDNKFFNVSEEKKLLDFNGWQFSTRKNTKLTQEEKTYNVLNDGIIEGLHSFLNPQDAIVWAWHWAGMRGQDIRVVPVKIYRDDLVCGGLAGGDIREYDTCYDGPGVISTKVQIMEKDLNNPLWKFNKFSLEKENLLTALNDNKFSFKSSNKYEYLKDY